MSIQDAINLLGKLLPLLLDLAGFFPVIGSVASVIRLAEDGVQVEEAAYALIMSPEGAKLRAVVEAFADSLGFKASFQAGGKIKIETREEVGDDFAHGLA